MKIYKYPITRWDDNGMARIEMPDGAGVLSVHVQNGEAFIWAVVNPGARKVTRFFAVYPTGAEIGDLPQSWNFLGTFLLLGGALVFHIWDTRREES